jgi:hypothetical protein
MIVADTFDHEALEMPFVEHDNVVEQVPVAAADKPLLLHSARDCGRWSASVRCRSF